MTACCLIFNGKTYEAESHAEALNKAFGFHVELVPATERFGRIADWWVGCFGLESKFISDAIGRDLYWDSKYWSQSAAEQDMAVSIVATLIRKNQIRFYVAPSISFD